MDSRRHPWGEQIRSILLLEMAAEMVSGPAWQVWRPTQPRLLLHKQGSARPWEYCLFASATTSGIDEVARGEVQLAMLNPAAPLALAVRGVGPFVEPLPLRVITTIPSWDQFGFAVAERTGITSLSDIRDGRYPLKISMRDQPDHADYMLVNETFRALGFSLEDVISWGGQVIPHPRIAVDADAVRRGEYDAFFEEEVRLWLPQALDAGMRFLPIDGPVRETLEALGWQCSSLSRSEYPRLATEVPTADFSGWPVFTHADAPDELVRWFCTALEARKERIPWEGGWTLPLERMCRNGPDTPLAAPLHPAAEAFWRERGYLP